MNEPILLQNKFSKQWTKAIVINKTQEPRSYLVKDGQGKILRRNTIYMKKIKNHDYCLEESDEEVDKDIDNSEREVVVENKKEITNNVIKTKSGRTINKPSRLGITV